MYVVGLQCAAISSVVCTSPIRILLPPNVKFTAASVNCAVALSGGGLGQPGPDPHCTRTHVHRPSDALHTQGDLHRDSVWDKDNVRFQFDLDSC
jgi:hypothetical protein